MIKSTSIPKEVIDRMTGCLNELELKSVLIYYRHFPQSCDSALKGIGSNIGFLDEAMLKMGHMTESKAISIIQEMAEENQDALNLVWHQGDGEGGAVLDYIGEAIGRSTPRGAPNIVQKDYKKKRIPRTLSKAVFERDAYRCVSCESYIDLTCDHIIPESKGGETVFKNLQTMCRSCNSKKGTKLVAGDLCK